MSGIDDIYDVTHPNALTSQLTFQNLFGVKPSDTMLISDLPIGPLIMQLKKLTGSHYMKELSEFLLNLLDEYEGLQEKIRTSDFSYNIPRYAAELREKLISSREEFWKQPELPVSMGIIIAECVEREVIASRATPSLRIKKANQTPNSSQDSSKLFRVVIVGLDSKTQMMITGRLANGTEWPESVVNPEIRETTKSLPKFQGTVVVQNSSNTGATFYNPKSIIEEIDPNGRNILCIEVPNGARSEAIQMMQGFRLQGESMLALALEKRKHPTCTAALLNAGFDDVMSLPLHMDELVMRLFALSNRNHDKINRTEQLGPLSLSWIDRPWKAPQLQSVYAENKGKIAPINLTRRELKLLECLIINQGELCSKEHLMAYAYDDVPVEDRPLLSMIKIYVCKIRRKTELACLAVGSVDTKVSDIVGSVRGKGFIVNALPNNSRRPTPNRVALNPTAIASE